MQNPISFKLRHSLTAEVLKAVFSLYLLVALTVTLIHMAAEYSITQKRVVRDMGLYTRTYEEKIIDSLKANHPKQLEATLSELLDNPAIHGVVINSKV